MKTVIFGAGAIGSYFAAQMHAAKQDVVLYDIDTEKVAAINRQGLKIKRLEDGGETVAQIPAYDNIDDLPPADLVIIMTKAYHTERAAREAALICQPETNVLTLQSGLGNVEEIAKHIADEHVFGGITYHSAYELGLGEVLHTAGGLSIVAPLLKSSLQTAMDLARLLTNCGISAGATTYMEPMLWKKLVINSAISPLSALYGLPNGMLPKNPEVVRDMVELVVEGVAVAQKVGVPLNYGEMWATVLDTCRRTAENRSAMLTDVENGRPTEIEAINGSIVRLGEINGVDTPTNVRMVRSVVAVQQQKW